MDQTTPTTETLALAAQLRQNLVGRGLPPDLAKLYSQHTRLLASQPGLSGWRLDEATARLQDAILLLEAGFVEREGREDRWIESLRRVGEILEWLAHPELNPEQLPLHLLAAAAYQLAGYPARATGLLNSASLSATGQASESQILRALLKADFPELLQQLTAYWARSVIEQRSSYDMNWQDADRLTANVQEMVTRETASALGVLCGFMRWGEASRIEKALNKILSISHLMLQGHNEYSWLLARLCYEATASFLAGSLRSALAELGTSLAEDGRKAIERYIRLNYLSSRSLVWPSQQAGIRRLFEQNSFALCTPTGSGKTTIAEIAILQSLFSNEDEDTGANGFISFTSFKSAPLVIYMVPSRALAAEVESRLSRVFRRIGDPEIIVTGLYGGTDWGPTDAWLTSDKPTVLICTYEKSEALIRFLGPLFLRRVSLIIIDEAHQVQFDGGTLGLQNAESRALRMEVLCARLFGYLDRERGRVIALSAVAAGFEQTLSNWVTGTTESLPTTVSYRSTRQLIGRLECRADHRYEIRYDLMDNVRLQFAGPEENTPYIPNPFPPLPAANPWANEGPEKRIRAHALWAAMNIAAADEYGKQSTVLISVTQRPGGYADDFLTLLDKTWAAIFLPNFFRAPVEADGEAYVTWNRCLQSCADYFGPASREYRLLQRGIVVHHGKMPGLMARLLIELISERIVHIVLATSTLSEGVNLPFETVLIPTLLRGQTSLTPREFSNLVGRAGRPGVGTEGRSLVLMPAKLRPDPNAWSIDNVRTTYFNLVRQLSNQRQTTTNETIARSPLAALLSLIEEEWRKISGISDSREFIRWLEETKPLEIETDQSGTETSSAAIDALDSLDSVLLSAVVEVEQNSSEAVSIDDLEKHLREIWSRTYARYAALEESILSELFVTRGRALQTRVYPDSSYRRRLYRTNLPARSGSQLLSRYSAIKQQLQTGATYTTWSDRERLSYITEAVAQVRSVTKFRQSEAVGRGANAPSWRDVLAWWLARKDASKTPAPKQISDWHDFVAQNFTYRFNWGLGSVIALAMDEAFDGKLLEPTLESWPSTELPWIVFWLKELIIWGTLDPVAAYLLARGSATTRDEAERAARAYYTTLPPETDADEQLNAAKIREWAANQKKADNAGDTNRPEIALRVRLLRNFTKSSQKYWNVIPVNTATHLYWLDPGGFPFAVCETPAGWRPDFLDRFDFTLDVINSAIVSGPYVSGQR